MPRQPFDESQRDKVRAVILSEAATIVGRAGLNGLSMRNLGEAVGLTPGALYRYFPSKQDVLVAMWRNGLDELGRAFMAFRAESDPLAAIRGMMKAYADFALADRDRFRALFLENDQGSFDLLVKETDALAPYDALRNCVAATLELRRFRPGDPDRTAQILWGTVHGALTLVVTVREIDFGDAAELVDEAIDTVLRGLENRENHDER